MRFLIAATLLATVILKSHAQEEDDSIRVLEEVTIRAYAADRPIEEIPAAIGLVQEKDLRRFGDASLVPVFNSLPGVRMEERSPASYRFSIRGSTLRSPFGVRNVKFYWNGLPMTDGGGNTYLNLFDFSSVGNAEVIKGPAGSLYGAGTGGTVLLTSPFPSKMQVELSANGGSFGQRRYRISGGVRGDRFVENFQYVDQRADGYREQSFMKRQLLQADIAFLLDSTNTLGVMLLSSKLEYGTPGGLTLSQFEDEPAQARPPTATVPGAVEQHAAVYNSTIFTGINYEHLWSRNWSTNFGIVTSLTDFKNPAIRNYETRKERNVGTRLVNQFQWTGKKIGGKITFGGEAQGFTSSILVTNNVQGTPGSQVSSNDEITSLLATGFLQAELYLPQKFYVTLGQSLNYLEYRDERLALTPVEIAERKFNSVLTPRIAVLKKLTPTLSVYASASKGFSPPSVAEVIPSTGIYNPTLNPEYGWSYEAGVKGRLLKNINFEIALYDFRLKETIVLQRDTSGADYFINAGNTTQQGVEININWAKSLGGILSSVRGWASYTFTDYKFGFYVNDGNDYSGNKLTGVAKDILVIGGDVFLKKGFYLSVTGNFTGRMPLDDANTAFASDYFLLGGRLGYTRSWRFPIEICLGVDNALNQHYSLGNDINAVGGRYYNAAPTTNYYAGLSVKLFREGE